MNPLNLNPKVAHFLLELIQGLGVVSAVTSLPGLGLISPWIGVVGGAAAGTATFLKTKVVGNIPTKEP